MFKQFMLWDAFHLLFEASASWSKKGNTPTHIKYQPIAPTVLDHQHATLKNQQHVQARQGGIFFLRCAASGLQHSCGAVDGHTSGVFTCLTGGIIAVYQEHSLSYTHRKRSVCLCTFLFLIFQVLCMVWVCFVKDAAVGDTACLSVSASTHLLLLFSLSVSLLFIFHTDNIMKTRLKDEPTKSG